MLKPLLIILACILLCSCAHHPLDCAMGIGGHDDCLPGTEGYEKMQNRMVAGPRQRTQDDELCKSYGLKFGTKAYADCRQNILGMRVSNGNQNAANQAAIMQSIIANQPKPQPYMMPVNRPVTTNCTKSGNGVSCMSE